MNDEYGNDFAPTTAAFHVDESGVRDVGLVFIGDSLTAGLGDPKGQGWVTRVVGRSADPSLLLHAYNLGVAGDASGDVLHRWEKECPPRWRPVGERRLVVQFGTNDAIAGTSLARHRLNLANILDECASRGIGTFVVGPPPPADPELREQVQALADAQQDVCERRLVTYVDTFHPLLGHEQWETDLANGDGVHPGAAGYGLMAWLVLNRGWREWLLPHGG